MNAEESTKKYFEVERRIKHEHWVQHGEASDSDIMLFKLKEKVTFSKTISPICLPASKSFDSDFFDKFGTVIGHGLSADKGPQHNTLQHVQLLILSPAKCRTYDHHEYKTRVTENSICTYYPHKDNCNGDSGGPLFVKKNNKLTQIGVVSWGLVCAGIGQPAVYTRVENYIDWIKEKAGNVICTN